MNKYYHQDIYKVEANARFEADKFFEDHETMIEFLRDNWEEYCNPIADEWKLLYIQDDGSKVTFTYEETQFEDDGVTIYEQKERQDWAYYETVSMTWLISKLERMTTNV